MKYMKGQTGSVNKATGLAQCMIHTGSSLSTSRPFVSVWMSSISKICRACRAEETQCVWVTDSGSVSEVWKKKRLCVKYEKHSRSWSQLSQKEWLLELLITQEDRTTGCVNFSRWVCRILSLFAELTERPDRTYRLYKHTSACRDWNTQQATPVEPPCTQAHTERAGDFYFNTEQQGLSFQPVLKKYQMKRHRPERRESRGRRVKRRPAVWIIKLFWRKAARPRLWMQIKLVS